MTKCLPPVNVGIDVGKSQLDVCILERDQAFAVPNEEISIGELVQRLRRFRLARVVVEATGRLQHPSSALLSLSASRLLSYPR